MTEYSDAIKSMMTFDKHDTDPEFLRERAEIEERKKFIDYSS